MVNEDGEIEQLTNEDLIKWSNLATELALVKAQEMALRKRIFKFCFTAPKEGTNKLIDAIAKALGIADGWVLKGNYKLNRKIDDAVLKALENDFKEKGIRVSEVIKWKPELSVSEYRTLTEEQRKFFDQCLIITPGSPELEIVLPKRASKG
jgi:hypothetical protein